jgi:hypothetical protein
MKNRLVTDMTPGEILEEEFLKPFGITQYRLASALFELTFWCSQENGNTSGCALQAEPV